MSEEYSKRWIVRLGRRRDGKKYYYRHDCCLTARKESSMLLSEDVAKQLAYAITTQHPDFYSWAVPYDARHPKAKKEAAEAAKAAKMVESMATGYDSATCVIVKEQEAVKCATV